MPPKAKAKSSGSRPSAAAAAKAASSSLLDPSAISRDSESSSASPAPPHILDSPQGEIALFRALTRHRPVGPDKHFKMVGLLSVVNKALVNVDGGGENVGVSADEIWDKLGRMYGLDKLDQLNSPTSPSQDSPYSHSRASRLPAPTKRAAASRGTRDPFGGQESDSSLSENEDEDEDGAGEDEEDGEGDGRDEDEEKEEPPTPKKRRKSKR